MSDLLDFGHTVQVTFLRLPGVFAPHPETALLADALGEHCARPPRHALDLCTGTGVLALALARAGARDVTAVDLSRRAALNARVNARLAGLRVRALCGDLFAPVAGRRFDVITSNPPYVPAPSAELPGHGRYRAFDAGLDGRVLLDRICAEAPRHLHPGGRLLLTHSSVSGVEESFEDGLLEYPHYTQPRLWEGRDTPDVLLSGNHAAVARWRREQALRLTRERRPDLPGAAAPAANPAKPRVRRKACGADPD